MAPVDPVDEQRSALCTKPWFLRLIFAFTPSRWAVRFALKHLYRKRAPLTKVLTNNLRMFSTTRRPFDEGLPLRLFSPFYDWLDSLVLYHRYWNHYYPNWKSARTLFSLSHFYGLGCFTIMSLVPRRYPEFTEASILWSLDVVHSQFLKYPKVHWLADNERPTQWSFPAISRS